ncbi:MAG: AI-2E family transporter [Lachnospiraceae bacterium]|nr:AI-2E family transporter [Lachnospiraceae bacterium]
MTNKNKPISTFSDMEEKHRFEANKNYFVISIYTFCVIVLSVIAIYILWHFSKVSSVVMNFISNLSAFVVAFFIAYFMNPFVNLLHNKLLSKKIKSEKLSISLSILVSYILVTALLAVLLFFILPEVYYSIADLTETISKAIPSISNKLINFIEDLEKKFPWFDWNTIEKQIQTSIPEFMKVTTNFVTYIFEKAINISISVISLVLSLIISVTVSVYMILDKKLLAKNACRVLYAITSKSKACAIVKTVRECNNIFYNFVMGKALDSSIIFVITFVLMSIFKLKFTLLISIFVGVTNMIPYFGPFIGAIPGIIILLIVDPIDAIIFTIEIIVIQQFDGLYLGPKILGDSCGIKPLWVIFGITLGGAYGGALGMFLGVPLTAILAHLVNKFIANRLIKNNITASDFKKIGL